MSDFVKELTELIQGMASNLNTVKEKQEVMEAQIASYQEAARRGFVLPSGDLKNPDEKDLKSFLGGYDMAYQGKRLIDKHYHPNHITSDETRQEMAKYFCLFIRAAVQQDPVALAKFRETYKATTTDIGDSGNVFPIPDIVDSEILTYARESSVVLRDARIWDMTSDKMSFPTETGSSATYWGNTSSEAAPTVSEVELDADELSAYAAVKNITLADARSDVVSWLTESFAEAIGQALDTAAFTGDGEGLYGGVSGLLSAKCGKSVVMSGSTAFSMISGTHLSNMIAQIDGVRKMGARFYMHGSILHFVRNLRDNDNRPIFIDTIGAPMSGSIWGYPYTEVISMPSTSGASTAFIVYGNMKHFAVGRRLGVSALQVNPYGAWTTNRTWFKVYNRWALNLALPNAFCRLLTSAT
jgi:HK97 family phage major capsid protein